MSILIRACAILALALTTLPGSHAVGSGTGRLSALDLRLLHRGAVQAGRHSPREVISWLDRQHGVQGAHLQQDGRTISIVYRDGGRALILPRQEASQPTLLPLFRRNLRPLSLSRQSVRRAIVLEPFASAQLGPTAGLEQIRVLKAAGLQVDTLYDQQVTIESMKSLYKYDVVYIHTHGGVNQGEAVIESGQPVIGDDPAMDQMIQKDEVFVTEVAGGSTTAYYGILSKFVYDYWGQFPANSLLFVNTCSLLQGWFFWKVLQMKSLSTLVSYDALPVLPDALQAGDRFFDDMATGITVSQAIAHAQGTPGYGVGPPGYGISRSDPSGGSSTGWTHLGYLGDGEVTLQGRSTAPLVATPYTSPTPITAPPAPPLPTATSTPTRTPTPIPTSTPTLTPTSTPTLTSTPTATNTPTPTSTPTLVVLPLQVHLRSTVMPGSRQSISVRTLPDIGVYFQVAYPNGDRQSAQRLSDAQGTVTYSYIQPASKIRPGHYTARVRVTAQGDGQLRTFRRSYRIGFARVDVSAALTTAPTGETISIWVHAVPRTRVNVDLVARTEIGQMNGLTDAQGWAYLPYRSPPHRAVPTGRRLLIRAWFVRGNAVYSAEATVVTPERTSAQLPLAT